MWSGLKRILAGLLNHSSRRVGILYLCTSSLFALVGVTATIAIQLDMLTPVSQLMGTAWYDKLLTGHGMLMVFLVLVPLFPGIFGQLVLPSAVGVRRTVRSVLGYIGWLCHLSGGVLVIVALLTGAYDGSWIMMMPASGFSAPFTLLILGLTLAALAAFLPSIDVITLVLSKEYRTIRISQLPLFAWFFLLGALVQVLVTPIRLLTLSVLFGSQKWGWTYFSLTDPDGIVRYQQIFWLYAGPAAVSLVLPAVGVILEVLIARSKTAVRFRNVVVASGVVLAVLSLASWSQHLVSTADAELAVLTGSLFGLLMIIPAGILLIQLIRLITPIPTPYWVTDILMFSSLSCGAIAGVGGILLAFPALAVHLHNTYFTVAHLHFALAGMIGGAFLTGLFHFWPQWWHTSFSERALRFAAFGFLTGTLLTFLPMFALGARGLPRSLYIYPESYLLPHVISTIGSIILVVSLVTATATLMWSLITRKSAGPVSNVNVGEFVYADKSLPVESSIL